MNVKRYDIAVVGASLGGLAAAAILSSAGKKTVVCTGAASIEDATGAGRQGLSFSPGRSLSYGYEPGGVFYQFFHDLGIAQDTPDYAKAYQVVLPDRRITVSPDREELFWELRREFPREIEKLIQFYQDITKESERIEKNRIRSLLFERKKAGDLIGRYGFSREVLAFFDVQSHYFFQRPFTDLTFSQLRTFSRHKPYRCYDGYSALVRTMSEILLRKGGEIRFNEPALELIIQGQRARLATTAQEGIEANAFLVDMADKRVPVQFFGIRDEVVPVGMLNDVLYSLDYGDPRNYLALSLSAKNDRGASSPGLRALTITYHGAADTSHASAESLAMLAKLMPYLADHLVFSEELISPEKLALPPGLSWKQIRGGYGHPAVLTAAKGRLLAFQDADYAFGEVLQAVRRVVKSLRAERH